jgi:hypothetical protein
MREDSRQSSIESRPDFAMRNSKDREKRHARDK